MKIEIDGDQLAEGIKTIRNVTAGATIHLEVVPNFLRLTAVNGGSALTTSVPMKLIEKSKVRACALDSAAFATSLTKLKVVQFEFLESSLVIRSGRYKAELIAHQYEKQVVIPEGEKEKGIKIKKSFIDKLSAILPKLELQPLLSTYAFVPFGVKVTREGAFIASYDFYQAAFVQMEDVKGDFEFVLPNNVFSMLAKEMKGQDYQLVITETSVYAYNDIFEYATAIPQSESSTVSFDDMQQLHSSLKGTTKKSGVGIKLKSEAIVQMIENGRAIYEKDSTFEFEIKGDKCKLELKSSSGKISTVIMLEEKAARDIAFSCDFHFFSTLMKKAGASIKLTVIPERMLLFTNKPVIYMMSLS